MDMVTIARNILMRTADIPPDGIEPYRRDQVQPAESWEVTQVRELIAENAKLKQENARRRLRIQELEAAIRAMREGI